MSAILSADDLNDFISPSVACIKPVETLPKQKEQLTSYEVTTEDKVQAENPPPASISLTDCLACSGCVTSAEAVLISLQSHTEVLSTLDAHPSLDVRKHVQGSSEPNSKLFVTSVSPQVRASLAAAYHISERQSGYMIEQLLSGPRGLRSGGQYGSGFTYVVDTNRMRETCLVLGADEVAQSLTGGSTAARPVLTSACPGWVCYAEKTHPHVLPHLSKLKSPQALTGTLLKSVLSKSLGIHPSQIWHLAIMPCFDKKLEASREELTDRWWANDQDTDASTSRVRDVDCVITSRELLTLANDRGINLPSLPLTPLPEEYRIPFPDSTISRFLFPKPRRRHHKHHDLAQSSAGGTSGGYLHYILASQQSRHPGSTIHTQRGRNADVTEFTLLSSTQETLLKCARFYGFRNIQNLVRRLKPARGSRLPAAAVAKRKEGMGNRKDDGGSEYAYVEVMACPGGCTNGGGQIRVDEAIALQSAAKRERELEGEMDSPGNGAGLSQKDWLRRVDSAYFSAHSSASSDAECDGSEIQSQLSDPNDDDDDDEEEELDPDREMHDPNFASDHELHPPTVKDLLAYWSAYTSIPLDKLVYTTFRKVESDVGQRKKGTTTTRPAEMERIAALAGSIGGGW